MSMHWKEIAGVETKHEDAPGFKKPLDHYAVWYVIAGSVFAALGLLFMVAAVGLIGNTPSPR